MGRDKKTTIFVIRGRSESYPPNIEIGGGGVSFSSVTRDGRFFLVDRTPNTSQTARANATTEHVVQASLRRSQRTPPVHTPLNLSTLQATTPAQQHRNLRHCGQNPPLLKGAQICPHMQLLPIVLCDFRYVHSTGRNRGGLASQNKILRDRSVFQERPQPCHGLSVGNALTRTRARNCAHAARQRWRQPACIRGCFAHHPSATRFFASRHSAHNNSDL